MLWCHTINLTYEYIYVNYHTVLGMSHVVVTCNTMHASCCAREWVVSHVHVSFRHQYISFCYLSLFHSVIFLSECEYIYE